MDLLASLKKLVEWERLLKAADKVDDLEQRIRALEAQAPAAPKHPTCPSCGVGRWHAQSTSPHPVFGGMGKSNVKWGCTNCAYTETKMQS